MNDKTEWVLVPREPTEEMKDRAHHWLDRCLAGIDSGEACVENVYEAMLSAAPSAPQGGGVEEGAIEKIALLFTRSGRHFVGKDDRDECMAKAKQAIALTAQPRTDAAQQGEVVVTRLGSSTGPIVAVTRQDGDGRVLSVIAEAAPPSGPAPVAGGAVAKLLQAWDTSPTKAGPDWIEKNARRECAHQLRAALAQDRASQAAAPSAPVRATLSNPWTGKPRDYRDVDSDPEGVLCVEPGATLKAATGVEGLTTKEAWWAGYRAGKGLPADTPRQEALAQQPAAEFYVDFPATIGTAGPFPLIDGRISIPNQTVQDIIARVDHQPAAVDEAALREVARQMRTRYAPAIGHSTGASGDVIANCAHDVAYTLSRWADQIDALAGQQQENGNG